MATMTIEIGILFLILGIMAFFFFTEKLPVDLTAFIGLAILIMLGYVKADEAFSGFASPAVITMLSIFFVSGALLNTGVADMVGERLHKWIGSAEIPLIISIMVVSAVLSAFMNNIAAVAVLLPAVGSLARSAGVCPSRLFMPLSFGAILGGTTTLVGTPPNLLAAEMLQKKGYEPFALFDFTPMGLSLLAVGVLYMCTLGRKLLPDRNLANEVRDQLDLSSVYQISNNLFSMAIPETSKLAGQTLEEADLGATLDLQVVGIVRNGKTTLAPMPSDILHAGDVMVVRGDQESVREIMKIKDLTVGQAASDSFDQTAGKFQIHTVQLLAPSFLLGRNLKQLNFRDHYHTTVVAIRRNHAWLEGDITSVALEEGDKLLLTGPQGVEHELEHEAHFRLLPTRRELLAELPQKIYVLHVPKDGRIAGRSIRESGLSQLVWILGIVRGDDVLVAMHPETQIQAGDDLYVSGEADQLHALKKLGDVDVMEEIHKVALESEKVGMLEVTLTPRSRARGKNLIHLDFRKTYGLQVLAIWRNGEILTQNIAHEALQLGDALLVQGPWRQFRKLHQASDFLVLSEKLHAPRKTSKAPFAVGSLLLMIALVVTGFQPIHVAAFVAATAVVLSGALTMEEAYRAVEWKAIFLVAAVLPVGFAIERTGAAQLMSQTVVDLGGPLGPYGILAGMCILASILSQCLDGAPSVVLLTPVAIQTAEQLGLDPHTIMMGVALSASAAFMTPFSHKANLLVMGAGGYRVVDYLKVGTPLTLILITLKVVLIPLFFGW